MDVLIRNATAADLNTYVIPTWLSSYAIGFVSKLCRADARHGVGRERYWGKQRAKIESLLSTSTTEVRVAELEGELIGYIVCDQTKRLVSYVFVGRVFRRQGVAKKLMPEWFSDGRAGAVYVDHLPPPWFTRVDASGKPGAWLNLPHVCIDLL